MKTREVALKLAQAAYVGMIVARVVMPWCSMLPARARWRRDAPVSTTGCPDDTCLCRCGSTMCACRG